MSNPDNQLDAVSLMATAQKEAGLEDWGEEAFVEGLEMYIKALATEARLSAVGAMAAAADITRLLVNRLRFQRELTLHPEILMEELIPPIVVLGLPRTGTSKLQGLLSAVPGVQRLDMWRLLNPAPMPGSRPGNPDPRIAIAQAYEQLLLDHHPGLMAAHPFVAEEVNEEILAWEMSFECPALTLRGWVPSYRDWLTSRPLDDSYRYLRSLLQYLQWQDGGARDRPFILKSPLHLGYFNVLLATLPQAIVVHCHRQPATCIASMCRATELTWWIMSDAVDREQVGRYVLNMLSAAIAAYLDERDRSHAKARITDVSYRELQGDPLGVVRQVCDQAGRPVSNAAEESLERWLQANPQYKFGRYEYSLEQYGLTLNMVEESFGEYIERFSSLMEPDLELKPTQ